VDGQPAEVPLSAFDAYTGTERVEADHALYALFGQVPGATFAEQIGVTLPPPFVTREVRGSVLAGEAGTPSNPLVHFVDVGTPGDHIGVYGLADEDWGGIENFELDYDPASIDQLNIGNFVDVSLRIGPGADFVTANIGNAKRGEVDARALDGRLGLNLSLTSDGPTGDSTFTVLGTTGPSEFGTAGGDDRLTLLPGTWDAAATRLDQLAGLMNDGSASKVNLYLGGGHVLVDASAMRAATEIFGGPTPGGATVTPEFTVALAEPGAGPTSVVFGAPVMRANLFVEGFLPDEFIPLVVTTPSGEEVGTLGRGILVPRPGETTPVPALQVTAPVSFVAVREDTSARLVFTGGSGLVLAAVPFEAPTIGTHGDGTVIRASGGADTIHHVPGEEGAVLVEGFDAAQDRILLDGADPDTVRVYDVMENASTPQARLGTIIAFGEVLPGVALGDFVFLPGAGRLALGEEILIA
jgi:hypothetical protein